MFFHWLRYSKDNRIFRRRIYEILRLKTSNIQLYKISIQHPSITGKHKEIGREKERLEFIGDSVLGVIISDYLYSRYPDKDEGFLTELKSKIVSRKNLNKIAISMGVDKLFDNNYLILKRSSIYGNALESIIGSLYLDRGYKKTYHFIVRCILAFHCNIEELSKKIYNFKGKIVEWSQRNNKDISYEYIKKDSMFRCSIYVENVILAEGYGHNKMQSSQSASRELYLKIQRNYSNQKLYKF